MQFEYQRHPQEVGRKKKVCKKEDLEKVSESVA